MSIRKLIALIALIAESQCVFAADVVADGGAAPVKLDARYLALVGVVHSGSASLAKNIDYIEKSLKSGPYGAKWRCGHPDRESGHWKITQNDLEAFSKNLAVVLASKTVADAADALKNIDAFVDKLHDRCHYVSAPVSKMSVLIAASKDAATSAVANALLKRADKIRPQILAQIPKSDGDWLDKMEDVHYVVDAYMMGLGLTDVSEDVFYWLIDSICLNWHDDDLQNKQVNASKVSKSFKLAESGIAILLAIDGIRSATTAGKSKAAVAVLDKAVKARMALMLSPNGSSKPTPEGLADAKAQCYNAYAELVEYAKGKTDLLAVKTILEAKSAEVKRMAENARK